jgi:hypothetical protein
LVTITQQAGREVCPDEPGRSSDENATGHGTR